MHRNPKMLELLARSSSIVAIIHAMAFLLMRVLKKIIGIWSRLGMPKLGARNR